MTKKTMVLSDLKPGEYAKIEDVSKKLSFRRRLMDIGFVKGFFIKCLQKSIGGDPVSYLINNTVVALRKKDSKYITVSESNELRRGD